MTREKLGSLITSFTPEGDFLAILSSNGIVKIWNTSNGSLLAEWKKPDGDSDVSYSCMACSFVGKKRKKERGACLLALGTNSGDVLAINVFTGGRKWTSTVCHPGGTTSLSFANNGRSLHTVGTDGMASELDSETGELIGKFKVSKRPISSLALSCDEKILAVVGAKILVFNMENGKELQKFPADLATFESFCLLQGSVQYIAISDGAKAIVTSGYGEKQLQVWKSDFSSGTITTGPVLSMRHSPLVLECKNSCNNEDGLVILSVSESGIAYLWNLKTISEEEVIPTRIVVKSTKAETGKQNSGSAKKSRIPVIAARLHGLQKDGQVSVLIAYGSTDYPQFSCFDITTPGDDIVVTATDDTMRTITGTLQENGEHRGKENSFMNLHNLEIEAADVPMQKKKANKKRAASDLDFATTGNIVDDGHLEAMDEIHTDDDLNEPTMGEKLASLCLLDADKAKSHEEQESSPRTKPPSADSVHVLLKQALHADDRALLFDCLYTQDEKVIVNSTSLLNPSDVLKLLDFLISIIQSRGAVLTCALPWLRSLLLQHASGIMSQESSLRALNSLYQLIDSRVSTFQSTLQLSSCLDYLYAGISDDMTDENSTMTPIIFEDNDGSDEQESEDAMETDQETDEEIEATKGFNEFEGSDSMSD
ncbi:hypothetical protein HHK36_013419 [Tetracentron sinense]|uniref:Small-subunit processome Utp12 domain-containing protein n=1 Tax=Tetracentron sinense TaxID=13715 RepID=A0A835DE58_TETSI|nr:hypothetical protein HHK36_013419 [Tetracentron sinense]